MKILLHSNAPTIPTGYGVQARLLIDKLIGDGHEVAMSCTYGSQGPIRYWTTPGGHNIRFYPQGWETNSPDVVLAHAEHFFDGDPSAGWIVLLADMWTLVRPKLLERMRKYQVAAWTPVDHHPTPPAVTAFLRGSEAVPVAMSKFGHDDLLRLGLDAEYVPLAVDTSAYKPTPRLDVDGVTVSARELFGLPVEPFVVGMVAMNKDGVNDRKGFNEAFRGFAKFHAMRPDSLLFVHTDRDGFAGGTNLDDLAAHAGIPEHAIKFSDQYAYRLGLPSEMLAAAYTAMDVLLAPSHGEGFCVPIVEAQACGTPVIVSNFSAQPELVGAGWTVEGQLRYDPSQHSSDFTPFVDSVVEQLAKAYLADLPSMSAQAIEFAQQYDIDRVYDRYWRPFLETLQPPRRDDLPKMKRVDVLVPLVRDENRDRLVSSFEATAPKGKARMLEGVTGRTYAENVNALLAESDADWVLVVGDDVEFLPGWFSAARDVSHRFDVIGTNDSEPGRIRNPEVAEGRHADHFFVRRSYIDEEGGSLDGPGILAPECYRHWWTDKEIIELAKARGVYGHAHECRIVHHHPGYDGDEAARRDDFVYMMAVQAAPDDAARFAEREPLIRGHKTWIGKS